MALGLCVLSIFWHLTHCFLPVRTSRSFVLKKDLGFKHTRHKTQICLRIDLISKLVLRRNYWCAYWLYQSRLKRSSIRCWQNDWNSLPVHLLRRSRHTDLKVSRNLNLFVCIFVDLKPNGSPAQSFFFVGTTRKRKCFAIGPPRDFGFKVI